MNSDLVLAWRGTSADSVDPATTCKQCTNPPENQKEGD